MRKIILQSMSYNRYNINKQVIGKVEFKAYTVWAGKKAAETVALEIERQPNDAIKFNAIDKISFTCHRDYLNEISDYKTHKRGAFSITTHGEYFTIHIHREYIPLNMNLSAFVHKVFKQIILGTEIFKVPVEKTEKPSQKKKFYKGNVCNSPSEFYNIIFKQLRLKCIELCFDMHSRIMNYVNGDNFFNHCGTLYSKDYKVYQVRPHKCKELLVDGSKTHSIICIYDKAKEQRERKKKEMKDELYRFEIRLRSERFSILKKERGSELLDNDYPSLLKALMPVIVKHFKKLNIDVSVLKASLPRTQKILFEILNSI